MEAFMVRLATGSRSTRVRKESEMLFSRRQKAKKKCVLGTNICIKEDNMLQFCNIFSSKVFEPTVVAILTNTLRIRFF